MSRVSRGSACWLRGRLSGGPRYLLLHVNSVCDASCRMCFSWQRMEERWDARGLPLEAHRRIAASLRPLPQLTVSGGEPLLRSDLVDLLGAYYEGAGTRFFTVPTNALSPARVARLVDLFLERCPDAFLNVCLPFHGAGERFDDMLGVEGAEARFTATLSLLRERRVRRPNLSILLNFVMSKFNFDGYREAIDRATELYPETPLGISLCRGRTHEADAGEVPIEVYEEAQRYLASRRRRMGVDNPYALLFDTLADRIAARVAGVARGRIDDLGCGAGRSLLVIYDDGSVYPCEMVDVVGMPAPQPRQDALAAPSACLGRLQDFDFDVGRLLDSPEARRTSRWLRDHRCACTWESAVYDRLVESPLELVRLGARAAGRALTARGLSA